ncbi:MAG: sigma 54-interacting transcriptional regulator [Myxococcales bacterium]|nr:sigma 54-interacting transcriptional regulator [Myxococcales bacterium]
MVETSLAARRRLDPATLWEAMRQLLDRLFGVLDSEAGMNEGLQILVDVLGADRAFILLVHADGSSQVVKGRDPKGAVHATESEEISRTIVARALAEGGPVRWDPMSEHGASESVISLGIMAALAAPLQAQKGRETRGVLYVDFRDPRKFVTDQHIEFFESAAPLLGAVLEQRDRLGVVREQLQEVRAHAIETTSAPRLDTLLSPPSLRGIHREVASALAGTASILVLGESGTGKTLLAHAIAEASPRRPIVRAMLGGSDDLNTITSELFGHERGAFSGAVARRAGLVELARGGTLVLDEILNLTPNAQKLLLDFTQFGTYRPLGHDRAEPKKADVRLIAATNGDLEAAIRDGRFRADLYYRLAAVTLVMPPLRERREDLPSLAEGVLRRADPTRGWQLSLPLRRLLLSEAFDWPGNVRQLERVIQRARERAVMVDPSCATLAPEHLDLRAIERTATPPTRDPSFDRFAIDKDRLEETWTQLQAERVKIEAVEQEAIEAALEKTGGNVTRAARELGIARTTLASRIEVLGLGRRKG